MNLPVEHQAERNRFQVVVEGHLGVAEYRLADGVMAVTHVEVAPELGGRGIAGALMQAVLAHASAQGLKVRPLCSYASSYMQRHSETKVLLA
ncbi:MAG: GNAT family N-acetyltransferase [Burkholderiales bacterium]|nr:GNAT family N-acetyltransferase [Burkholderiales bacterium]